MTLRQYLFTMTIATILCWLAWILVIINTDPNHSNAVVFGFFYISLFFALLGTISIITFVLYYFFSRSYQAMFRYVQKSFKGAVVVSAILIFLLFLQGSQLLNFWNLTIFVLIIGLLASFFLSLKKG